MESVLALIFARCSKISFYKSYKHNRYLLFHKSTFDNSKYFALTVRLVFLTEEISVLKIVMFHEMVLSVYIHKWFPVYTICIRIMNENMVQWIYVSRGVKSKIYSSMNTVETRLCPISVL